MTQTVGIVTNHIANLLGISSITNPSIYMGDSNVKHMQTSHPTDYAKYSSEIPNILRNPDYVGLNPRDNSIEYVKEYLINNEYVKVAVRISSNGNYYARSLYVLNNNRVNNFIKAGTLKKV